MSRVRDNLLSIFNRSNVEEDELSLSIAKDFKFKYNKKDRQWVSLPREIRGEKISALFKRFIDEYKKHYRVDVAAKEFYQLSDQEIEDMFDELPYFLKSFHGNEQFKPNAASFLKEKIWAQDYPRKIQRDRTKKIGLMDANSWDEYIFSLPEEQRAAIEGYKEIISFESFKNLINAGEKK